MTKDTKTKLKKSTGKIKRHTKAIIDKLEKDPSLKQTDAYIEVMKLDPKTPEDRKKAGDNASRLLNTPNAQLYKDEHIHTATMTTIEVLETARSQKEDIKWAQLASQQAEKILDRHYGKATNKTESTSLNVSVNAEASQETAQAFTEFLKQKTAIPNPTQIDE